MTSKEAIDILKSECYVFNPLNLDRSTMINKALDKAVEALKIMSYFENDKESVEEFYNKLKEKENDT